MLSGILANERDPNTAAQQRWLRAIYGKHPYSRSDQGTKDSLTTITADDIRAFHKANFPRGGLHVAVAGDIDVATLMPVACAIIRTTLPLPILTLWCSTASSRMARRTPEMPPPLMKMP